MLPRISLFTVAVFACVATAGAQDPVKWDATSTASVAAGGTATVKVAAKIDAGYHIYSITQGSGGPNPTRIKLLKPFSLGGKIKASPFESKFDENFGLNVETYHDSATFFVPVSIPKTTKAGTQKVRVEARYQVCNERSCLPPKLEKMNVDVKVKGKAGQ